MAEDESIELICQRIRALGRNDVVELGQLPAAVHVHWRDLRSAKIVITGPQRDHLLQEHPEMEVLIPRSCCAH